MGTNYYAIDNVCPHCGRGDSPLHIGKSSAGWCFSLNVHPSLGINSLSDWLAFIDTKHLAIQDEYHQPVTVQELREVIMDRSWPHPRTLNDIDMRRNHAVQGPNGLLRHAIDDRCVGHGPGTWDLMVGDFS